MNQINYKNEYSLLRDKNNTVIFCFQLRYDFDSQIILDFYSDGLILEPKLIMNLSNSIFNKKSTGIVIAEGNDYNEYSSKLQQCITNIIDLQMTLNNYVKCLINLESVSKSFENIAKIRKLTLKDFDCYYQSIINVMSFTRISNLIDIECNDMNTISIPSHTLLLEDGLYNYSNSKISFEDFRTEFAFLYDFYIQENILENKESLDKFIYLKKFNFHNTSFQAICNSDHKNRFSRAFYTLGWCEEFRRVLQQRALRNFREIMKFMRLDIHNNCCADIRERLMIYDTN